MDQDPPRDGQSPSFSNAPTDMDAGTSPAAATSAASAWPGGMQRLADRYQLEEPIASGGAAIVWRAFDDVLSRSVAIKLLHPHLAGDPTTVERFRLESINAARLTHPNVVQIYDTGQQNDVVYLVMEYVDGPSLRELLKQSGPLDPSVVAALGEQVASALGEAHTQGVVHRDVKPANILLTSDGVAKVTDFGIAKALSGSQATLTSPGTVVGTAAYVAPEQLEGGPVDARADVYALGVVLYECLTGQPAFQGDTPTATAAARLTQDLLPPRQLRADVPRPLNDVVVRATRREPDERHADGAALAAALSPLVHARPSDVTALLLSAPERASSDASVAEMRTVDATPSQRTSSGSGWRLAGAFFGGLALALLAFFSTQLLQSDDPGEQSPNVALIPVMNAGDFDPHAREQAENPEDVPLAHDGDLETSWATETYRNDPALGGLKPGVGIWFDLGEPVEVDRLQLILGTPGVNVEIRMRDEPPDVSRDDETSWQLVETGTDLEEEATIPLDTTGQYWLLWFTDLAPSGDGGFEAVVKEVGFLRP